MTMLNDYQHFNGRHYETGTVHNYYDYLNIKAPHTGKSYSEALLMGISGGITFGYFTFAYQGVDPQCNILTRNTFDAWDTMLSRLGVEQTLLHSTIEDKAIRNLLNILENGEPAIVWSDRWSLPYNALPISDKMWGAFPVIVFGYDEENDLVHIADGSQKSFTVTPQELASARGRIKKYKNRVVSLSPPNSSKLASAVKMGIWDTIKIFTESPPKGSKNNFGLAGMKYWAKMLTTPNQKKSWEKLFPKGRNLIAGLSSAYYYAFLFSKDLRMDGERTLFAEFLDEASVILDNRALIGIGNQFRKSAAEWKKLSTTLLPNQIDSFNQLRQLMFEKESYFIHQGNQNLKKANQYRVDIEELKAKIGEDFPLSDDEIITFREKIANQIMIIHDIEEMAIQELRDVIS